MKNFPYHCKELINLFALGTYKNYENLIEFNKICDYESCEYSNEKLRNAETNYKKYIETTNGILKSVQYEYQRELDFLYYSLDYDIYKSAEETINYAKILEHLAGLHYNTKIQAIFLPREESHADKMINNEFLKKHKMDISKTTSELVCGNSRISYEFFKQKNNDLHEYKHIRASKGFRESYGNKKPYMFCFIIEYPNYLYDEDKTPFIIEGFDILN